jgi:hypothetical protein
VKALTNEHLIDLGINTKIPPIELLSADFMANVRKHAGGDPEAKAIEMEHAIRKSKWNRTDAELDFLSESFAMRRGREKGDVITPLLHRPDLLPRCYQGRRDRPHLSPFQKHPRL